MQIGYNLNRLFAYVHRIGQSISVYEHGGRRRAAGLEEGADDGANPRRLFAENVVRNRHQAAVSDERTRNGPHGVDSVSEVKYYW